VSKRPIELEHQLYSLPSGIATLNAARGSIVVMDWQLLRERSLYDAYVAGVDPQLWAALSEATAGSWVPIEQLHAHYRALDALQLSEAQVQEIGWNVGERVHGAFLHTLMRLAGKCGVSPWLALEQTYKLWTRSWRGGAIVVHRLARTTARVSLSEAPICSSLFFCNSLGGAVAAGVSPFGKDVQVEVIAGSRTPSTVGFRVSWTA
jgi:hypothetical protein